VEVVFILGVWDACLIINRAQWLGQLLRVIALFRIIPGHECMNSLDLSVGFIHNARIKLQVAFQTINDYMRLKLSNSQVYLDFLNNGTGRSNVKFQIPFYKRIQRSFSQPG